MLVPHDAVHQDSQDFADIANDREGGGGNGRPKCEGEVAHAHPSHTREDEGDDSGQRQMTAGQDPGLVCDDHDEDHGKRGQRILHETGLSV